ncbi:toxin-antitoxin system toxin subunit [Leucobacter insecticola]|uniref:Toxin-antitoxin system toxin subunit n=1 Tax=Leucobacter insecticola TaxID=2714934 RepID=A0A6G8FLF8_9MICO|nr:toxin-antitoxin system toxin subunit [Leucobacter insecticola]
MRWRDSESDPPRWGIIGFDNSARAVELVAVELGDGDLLIIHANYLTAGFEREMRDAR